ncbi:LCP family protein [Clostridium rectalis]|uniref:LCP family protein n=1 Tax=Clostridium rectalis TaxID=2040295 RepID=UPI001FA98FC4|nr:LCP family protein [Clostridium rectalis]
MKKRKKGKKNKTIRTIIISILLIIVGVCAFMYYYLLGFSKSRIGQGGLASIDTKEVIPGEPVNILVMGVDIGNPNNKAEPQRTDTIMLINYNPKVKKLNVVSIPRDTRVVINGKAQKINAAHAIGGVSSLINCVEELLHVNINYYGKVDYNGFRKIIDSIGGIDMDIQNNMDYDDASQDLHIHFKKGEKVHLNGKKAEEFFRWRKNNDGTGFAEGDLGRIENQHIFINKVIDKIKSPAIIPRIPGLMTTLPKYAETNMKPEEIIKYAYTFSRVDKENMNVTTLKGTPKYIGQVSYFIYSENQNKELIKELQGNGSYDGITNSFNRSGAYVNILNGTNINGLAARLSNRLKQKGYVNITTGNGKKTNESKIQVSGVSKKSVSIIKRDFGIENVEIIDSNSEKVTITVLLGKDFKETK